MKTRKILCLALFLGAFGGSLAAAGAHTPTSRKPGDLRAAGKVEFPISAAPAVRPEFERGVVLLHSFFYEEARRIFTAVAEQDPTCAMAQWASGNAISLLVDSIG
jgi:hypothetical protein